MIADRVHAAVAFELKAGHFVSRRRRRSCARCFDCAAQGAEPILHQLLELTGPVPLLGILGDEGKRLNGKAFRRLFVELLTLHHAQAHLEERFRRRIGMKDAKLGPDGENRQRQRVHDEVVEAPAHQAASRLWRA